MRGAERVAYEVEQVRPYRVEVDLVSQPCAEGVERVGSVVVGAVEAAVDGILDSTAQGLEERDSTSRTKA